MTTTNGSSGTPIRSSVRGLSSLGILIVNCRSTVEMTLGPTGKRLWRQLRPGECHRPVAMAMELEIMANMAKAAVMAQSSPCDSSWVRGT